MNMKASLKEKFKSKEKTEKKEKVQKKSILDYFSSAEIEIIKKDIQQVWRRYSLRFVMIAIPLLMVVIIPIVFIVAINFITVNSSSVLPANITELFSSASSTSEQDYRQAMFSAFTTLLCPMFYLTVPIVCSVSIATSAFITCREEGTLETLMLSSLDERQIFNSKISGCLLSSLIISWVSFITMAIALSVGDIIISSPFFLNLEWLIIVVLLTPALSLFCSIYIVGNSNKIKTEGESMQLMAYFILLIVVIYMCEFNGAFKINALFLFVFSVIIIIVDFIMFNKIGKSFTAEKVLSQKVLIDKHLKS